MNAGAARDRVALVTGASSGIGAATAECLAGAGFQVVLAARRRDLLAALVEKIAAAGGRALAVPTDLADEKATSRLVSRTLEAFGRVDVLVNNAGFSLAGALEQLSRDDLRSTFEVNLLAGLQLAGELTPVMRDQGGGRIINMGSLAASVPAPLAIPYAATKGALAAATDGLRLELARWGIDVILVIPGFVDTPTFDNARAWGMRLREDPANPYRQLMLDLDEFALAQLEPRSRPRTSGAGRPGRHRGAPARALLRALLRAPAERRDARAARALARSHPRAGLQAPPARATRVTPALRSGSAPPARPPRSARGRPAAPRRDRPCRASSSRPDRAPRAPRGRSRPARAAPASR